MQHGVCTPEITKLSWNSFDMDFWSDESDWGVETSNQVFSVGKTNKMNLDPAIYKGHAKVRYSSCQTGKRGFQVDDIESKDGWSCDTSAPEG